MRSLVDIYLLRRYHGFLASIAHEIGGDPNRPETIVQAAQSLRAALARHRGYHDIPRMPDGRSIAFDVVGR